MGESATADITHSADKHKSDLPISTNVNENAANGRSSPWMATLVTALQGDVRQQDRCLKRKRNPRTAVETNRVPVRGRWRQRTLRVGVGLLHVDSAKRTGCRVRARLRFNSPGVRNSNGNRHGSVGQQFRHLPSLLVWIIKMRGCLRPIDTNTRSGCLQLVDMTNYQASGRRGGPGSIPQGTYRSSPVGLRVSVPPCECCSRSLRRL